MNKDYLDFLKRTDHQQFMDMLISRYIESEESMLKTILASLLKLDYKDITTEHAKNLTRVFPHMEHGWYSLYYEQVLIGRVDYVPTGVLFTPAAPFNGNSSPS